jgi:apolipoprotein N-acyltransferase
MRASLVLLVRPRQYKKCTYPHSVLDSPTGTKVVLDGIGAFAYIHLTPTVARNKGRDVMSAFKSPFPMRIFFLTLSSFLWLGIGLNGFSQASWAIYVPASTLLFAAATGFCPGLITSNFLFRSRSAKAEAGYR